MVDGTGVNEKVASAETEPGSPLISLMVIRAALPRPARHGGETVPPERLNGERRRPLQHQVAHDLARHRAEAEAVSGEPRGNDQILRAPALAR